VTCRSGDRSARAVDLLAAMAESSRMKTVELWYEALEVGELVAALPRATRTTTP
jgi:hypothetical protein